MDSWLDEIHAQIAYMAKKTKPSLAPIVVVRDSGSLRVAVIKSNMAIACITITVVAIYSTRFELNLRFRSKAVNKSVIMLMMASTIITFIIRVTTAVK